MKRCTAMLLSVLLLACLLITPWSGSSADAKETVSLGEQRIYYKDNITITADALRYATGGDIEIDFTIAYAGGGTRIVYFPEMYVNDWLVPFAHIENYPVTKGKPLSITLQTDASIPELYEMMQLDEVQKVKLAVWIYNEAYYVQSQGYTQEAVNPDLPADFAQSYDVFGTVLFDDATIRIAQLGYDPATKTALLAIEKKQTSKWTKVSLDVLFNGCRALDTNVYLLDKGVRALMLVDGTADCAAFGISEVMRTDVYVTYYHSNRLQKPFMVTLQADGAAASTEETYTPDFRGEPVYEDANCALYYAGAQHYYSDSDAIVFYCRNKTKDKDLALFTAYEYILLDGERVEATQQGVNVYPGSVSQIIIVAQGWDYTDLSGYDRLETTLSVCKIAGGYHEQLVTTGKLDLPLHGVPSPLEAGAEQTGAKT